MKLEDQLAALARLGAGPMDLAAEQQLEAALADRSSHLVARAARVARERELGRLGPALEAAFVRFMAGPAARDRGCVARRALVEALDAVEADAAEVFVAGVRHVEREAGRDVAAPLRAASAIALARRRDSRALALVIELLADAEPEARAGAARALGALGPEGAALLRFKLLSGDREVGVLWECASGLLAAEGEPAVGFLARFLAGDRLELAEGVALALGEGRPAGALEALAQAWERAREPALRSSLLAAIALLRRDEAVDFLARVVVEADERRVSEAGRALALLRHDARVALRFEALGGARGGLVAEIVRRAFG